MTNDTTTSSGFVAPLSQLLGFEPGDYVSIATQGVRVARTVSVDDLDFEYAAGLLSQEDTWIGAQPVKPSTPDRRASASDVACVRVLYADFDRKDSTDDDQINRAISELSATLGVEPISVVDSGGGLHPRWKLEAPIEPGDAKGVLNRWKLTVLRVSQECGFKADSVFDLPRVLRLPGTVNEKYDHRPEVTIAARSRAVVPISAAWSRLDMARSGKSPLATEKPSVDADVAAEALQVPPIERPQLKQTLSERYVNAEVGKDIERLRALSRDGWEGEPWHNTTRDVAFRLAKIAVSPETKYSAAELWDMFLEAAPQDDEGFDEERVEQYWESGIERATEEMGLGNSYEMIGSGDDLFAEEMDGLLDGARVSRESRLDLDDWEGFESVVADEPEEVAPAAERYASLETPLIPGFGGVAALRMIDLSTVRDTMLQRIDATAEDVSDLHYEHEEYLHPHCPKCFPDTWRGQLARWFLRGGVDPLSIRPPAGGLAPGEGFYDISELLEKDGPRMMIEGYLPDRSVGIMRGQGSAGKTFMAISMAMAVIRWGLKSWQDPLSAEEGDWGAVNVHGGVLFLAGESYLGIRDRFMALASREGVSPDDLVGRLTIQPRVPDFFNGDAHLDALLEFLRKREDIRLVVIDTLQKAAVGADQNSASDMAKVNMNFARVRDAMGGGSVMVIAHTGKDDDRARGSSAIEDDADFVLHVKNSGDGLRKLSVEKMRDGEMGPEFDFVLSPEGASAVVAPGGQVQAGSGLESQKVVAKAMYEIHASASWDGNMTVNDIMTQTDDDMSKKTVRRALTALKAENRVVLVSDSPQRYRMTPQGRAWTEAQGLGVFMR